MRAANRRWPIRPPSVVLALILLAGCGGEVGPGPPPPAPAEIFGDVTAEVGLDFVHRSGATGEYYFPEIIGAGGAFLDYDNDGDLDVYLLQGSPFEDAGAAAAPAGPWIDRLFRNDLEILPDGSRRLRFVDVTSESGITAAGYGMGAAAGDVDNDGWVDLYVTNWGPNQLWRNNGAGADGRVTFSEVTAAAGAGDDRWSTSASFFDFDRDGWLDLYVANYVEFRVAGHSSCRSAGSAEGYCGPQTYDPEPDRLLRNAGAAAGRVRFEDVTGAGGILSEAHAGLGVVSADFDGDGWVDLYVANDGQPNLLWLNRGGARFDNRALLHGCAVNADGSQEASMGVDAGDLDRDGDPDLFLTHLRRETNTAYLNAGDGFFHDVSGALRLASGSLPFTGFGTAMLDFDNDGWLDVAAVNGAVAAIESLVQAEDPDPYRQVNQLFRNLGDASFEEIAPARAGPAFAAAEVSRGLAVGDVDNDGDPDLLITNTGGPPRLALNRVGQQRHWLGLRLVGTAGRRDMLGARVTLVLAGGESRHARVRADASYCSARDPRVLFGLGGRRQVEAVRVSWPDGRGETWGPVPIDAYSTLVEGSGRPWEAAGE